MIIINNNVSEKQQIEEPNPFIERIQEIGLKNFFGGNRRRLYILLLLMVPMSGIAHFYVGRLFFGIASITLTAMAIPGIILLAGGWLNSQPLWYLVIPLLFMALLPWIYGIIAGMYWALQTDEKFQKKFFNKTN